MYEADELCDRIAFIDKGQLIKVDTPENLKQVTDSLSVIECKIIGVEPSQIQLLSELPAVQHIQVEQQDHYVSVRLHTREPQTLVPIIYETVQHGIITDLSISKPTLEDAYVRIVGGKAS